MDPAQRETGRTRHTADGLTSARVQRESETLYQGLQSLLLGFFCTKADERQYFSMSTLWRRTLGLWSLCGWRPVAGICVWGYGKTSAQTLGSLRPTLTRSISGPIVIFAEARRQVKSVTPTGRGGCLGHTSDSLVTHCWRQAGQPKSQQTAKSNHSTGR